MAVKCGKCKAHHIDSNAVRECYADVWPRPKLVRPEIDRPSARLDDTGSYRRVPARTAPGAVAVAESRPAVLSRETASAALTDVLRVPAGKYAVDWAPNGELKFYQIDYGKAGTRWAGWTFISLLIGNPGSLRKVAIRDRAGSRRIFEAVAADPSAASALFGRELGICGVCSSPLTNEESRERGIGPVCASKRGW